MAKKEVVADPNLVAYCGLYCGACPRYLRAGCPGCLENERATWCAVRKCCKENELRTCADCASHSDPNSCRSYNNLIARAVGFFLRSNRRACILQIRELGVAGHAADMAQHRRMTIRR
jgi:hypothetical protein